MTRRHFWCKIWSTVFHESILEIIVWNVIGCGCRLPATINTIYRQSIFGLIIRRVICYPSHPDLIIRGLWKLFNKWQKKHTQKIICKLKKKRRDFLRNQKFKIFYSFNKSKKSGENFEIPADIKKQAEIETASLTRKNPEQFIKRASRNLKSRAKLEELKEFLHQIFCIWMKHLCHP